MAIVSDMSQGLCFGLVSMIMSVWGNDISVYMVAADDIHHGSHGRQAILLSLNRVPSGKQVPPHCNTQGQLCNERPTEAPQTLRDTGDACKLRHRFKIGREADGSADRLRHTSTGLLHERQCSF